jgi:chorismate mutase/prephenate dehydratase
MKNLDKLRKKIDLIDDNLLKLLQNRSKLAVEIGNLKSKNSINSNLFRPERQIKILNRLLLKKNKFLVRKIS